MSGGCTKATRDEGPADRPLLHDLLADLERHLICAYVAGTNQNLEELLARTDDDARRLLTQASQYASSRLSEVEARSHYLHQLHGEP